MHPAHAEAEKNTKSAAERPNKAAIHIFYNILFDKHGRVVYIVDIDNRYHHGLWVEE